MTDAGANNRSYVENNVFNRQTEQGIGDVATHQGAVTIKNNTFVIETGGAGVWQYSGSGGTTTGQVFKNNVFYYPSGSSAYDILLQSSSAGGATLFSDIDYNLYRSSGLNLGDRTAGGSDPYASLAAWATRVGGESHSLTGTPTFVNSSGNTAASYALASGTGKNAGSDGTDMGAWGAGATQIGIDWAP